MTNDFFQTSKVWVREWNTECTNLRKRIMIRVIVTLNFYDWYSFIVYISLIQSISRKIWNLVYLRGKGKWRNCWIILILMKCYCVATSYRDAQEGYCNFLIHDKKAFEWINNHLVRLHFPNRINKIPFVIKEIVFHNVIEKTA